MTRAAWAAFGAALLLARPAEASAGGRSCVERAGAVVGEQRCRRFGQGWSDEDGDFPFVVRTTLDSVFVPFAPSQTIDVQPASRAGVAPPSLSFPAELSGARFWGGTLRFEYHLKNFFVGLGMSFAGGAARVPAGALGPGSSATTLAGVVFGPSLPIGVSIPFDELVVRLELVPQILLVGLENAPASVLLPTASLEATRLLLEPRVEVSYWPTRFVSFLVWTGTGGTGAVPRSFGLGIGVHLDGYDGDRSLF